jgi:hypothetical protein
MVDLLGVQTIIAAGVGNGVFHQSQSRFQQGRRRWLVQT